MKSKLNSIFHKIKVVLRRQQWKEILIMLFFLLLSSGFWLLQSLQQSYEKEIELPLRYKNVPSEWVLLESNPKKIHIILKDKGTTLMYYSRKANFVPVDISVAELPLTSDSSVLVSHQMLRAAMSKQLISSTSLISVTPREINIEYDSLSRRTVPVIANITVNTRPGFQISDSIKVSNPQIQLYGSAKTLDTLKHIKTKHILLEDVSKTQQLRAHLDLPSGVKTNYETVKLSVPVEEFTEKKMLLPVLCNDIPSGYTLRVFPPEVEVMCNIPLSQFKKLTANLLQIQIPFSEFEKNQETGKLPVRLTQKAPWVSNTSIRPNQVEFIIEYIEND